MHLHLTHMCKFSTYFIAKYCSGRVARRVFSAAFARVAVRRHG
jgi:hypothetical protein